MYKQIFNKSDGTPLLIESIPNLDTGEDYFEYNKSDYTEEMPPSVLYEPIYYENNEWHGASKEEWKKNNQENQHITPSDNDFLNAQLISNDIEHNTKIETLQQDIANLTAELLELKGGMDNVSNS